MKMLKIAAAVAVAALVLGGCGGSGGGEGSGGSGAYSLFDYMDAPDRNLSGYIERVAMSGGYPGGLTADGSMTWTNDARIDYNRSNTYDYQFMHDANGMPMIADRYAPGEGEYNFFKLHDGNILFYARTYEAMMFTGHYTDIANARPFVLTDRADVGDVVFEDNNVYDENGSVVEDPGERLIEYLRRTCTLAEHIPNYKGLGEALHIHCELAHKDQDGWPEPADWRMRIEYYFVKGKGLVRSYYLGVKKNVRREGVFFYKQYALRTFTDE